MPTHIILWYSTFTQIYTHWTDKNVVLASRQCLLHITFVLHVNCIDTKYNPCVKEEIKLINQS